MPQRNNRDGRPMGMVQLEDPATWQRYRKKRCRTCWAGCCTLVVEVTAEDLIRLELTDAWEVRHAFKVLLKRLKKKGIVQHYHSGTGKFTLQQNSDGSCTYLDSQRNCQVYTKRPSVCRNHPRVVSPRPGFCPYRPKP